MANTDPILTISVAAKMLKLHPRTLMLYEKEGFIGPHRTKTNRRLFSFTDLENLQFIIYLTQVKGINLKGVHKLLEAIEVSQKANLDLTKILFPDFKIKKLI